MSATPSPPILAGRYRVLAAIGRGGMGEVLKVEDILHDDRVLALKRFRLEGGASSALPYLRREFLTLAKLRHPNVATVYDFGVVPREGAPPGEEAEPAAGAPAEAYFTAELVEGIDLFHATDGAAWDEVYDLLVQVCRGLAYVHSRGIIHRDIKPSNVLVTRPAAAPAEGDARPRPLVKLIDFGLALALRGPERGRGLRPSERLRRASAESGDESTADAPIRGTVHYLAPEVIRGGPIDRRADLYSLGVTVFEVATRARPFAGGSSRDVIRHHLSDPPPRPRALRPDIPEPLERLILRLLEKEPAARFASADAVIRALARLVGRPFEVETKETSESWVLSGRFVGRDEELDRLVAWFRAQEGPPAAILTGDAGIGKSRLVRELKHAVQVAGCGDLAQPCETIEVHCGEASRAYAPIAEAVRRLLRLLGDESAALLGPHAALVRRFAGEGDWQGAGGVLPDKEASDDDDPARERIRLFDAVVSFLLGAAARRPALLLVTDIHRADEGTVALLAHLARALGVAAREAGRRPGFLFVATARLAQVAGPAAEPGRTIRALEEEGLALVLDLPPIRPEDVAELGATMLGVPALPEELERFLVQKAGGNPAFVQELMKSLLEAGAVKVDRGVVRAAGLEAQPVPASLAEVCRARLARLDADERAALEALAVAREPSPVALIQAAVASPDPEVLARALDRLERRGIVSRARPAAGEGAADAPPLCAFAHDLLRETVYAETPPARRAALHGAIGEALVRMRGADPGGAELALLAEHFAEAGIVERAFAYAVLAARDAAALFANERAIALYERALSLAEAAKASPAATLEILEALGCVFERIGRHERAESCYVQILAHPDAEALLGPAGLARIHRRLGETHETRGEYDIALESFAAGIRLLGAQDRPDAVEGAKLRGATASVYVKSGLYDDAIGFCRSGLELLGATESAGSAALLNTIGIALSGKGEYEQAAAHFERSLAIREALDDPEGVAKTLNNLGTVYVERGQVGRAIAFFEQALERGERTGDLRGMADTAANLGRAYGALGDDDRALAHFRRATDLLERLGDPEAIAAAYERLGALAADLGDYESATNYLDRAMRYLRRLGETREAAAAATLAGRLYTAMGAFVEARTATDEALRLASRFEAKRDEAAALHVLGRLERAEGRAEAAERALQGARTLYAKVGNEVEGALVTVDILETLLDRGELDPARRIAEQLEPSVRELRAERVVTAFEIATGRLATALGQHGEAARRLDRACERARAGRRPEVEWRAEHALARAYDAAGVPDRALAALVRAMEVVRELYQRVPARWRSAYLAEASRQALRADFQRVRAMTQQAGGYPVT